MQYILGAIAAIFAIYLALWLTVAAFMIVVLPAMVILLSAGMAAGIVIAIVVGLRALIGGRPWRPLTITPDQVVTGTAGLPTLRGDKRFPRDRAWPNYLVTQCRFDVRTIWDVLEDLLRDGWQWITNRGKAFGVTGWVALGLSVYPVWVAVMAGAVIGFAAIVLLIAVAAAVELSGWLIVAGALRSVDFAIRRVRKASGSCPSCYYVTNLPGIPCPGCRRIHRDIRPGWLGAVWRRCGCGTVLPTTVLRAANRLIATCPRCEQPLRRGAAVLTDIRLPVFGPVSAGKTRLVFAGLVALRQRAAAVGAGLTFVDQASDQAFRDAATIVGDGANTSKTPAGRLPHAITALVTRQRKSALLHLFDAAGEFYLDRDDNSELEFLDHAQGLVLVVDPFSMHWVVDHLGDGLRARLAAAHPAATDPEQVYHITARRLRDYGVDTAKRRLAVAVVKADLLFDLPLAADLRAGQVRQWLQVAGLDNLVLSAERDFAEVAYFVVASTASQPAEFLSPANPFGWLMEHAGMSLRPQGFQEQQPTRAQERA